MSKTPAALYPGFAPTCPAINAAIEPGIQPVCDVLNSIPGIHTLWSCEGHPTRNAAPYVVFIANQFTAFKISSLLKSAQRHGTKYCWGMSANFRDDGSLQYKIEPNDIRVQRARSCLWLFGGWSKGAMNQELQRLASVLRMMKYET